MRPHRGVGVTVLTAGAVVLLLALAAPAWAQQPSGIAGVVRDTSGAVLPGVTVEAESPALIEQVRTVYTDGQGRYNIVDLRPGEYVVTFTLPGFNVVRREGIQLPAGFTATVNADMQVGALEETITVTGTAPLVDTQSVRAQTVVSSEQLQSLPAGNMGIVTFINLTPGMSGPADVGGTLGAHRSMAGQVATYRGRASGKINFDGMGVLNLNGTGNAAYIVNGVLVEEMVLETGGISAESTSAGYGFNAIPKEGSNSFRFTGAGLFSNSAMQSDNLNDTLRSRGLNDVDKVTRIYDGSLTAGGPITQNKMWFFGGIRYWGNTGEKGGIFWNATQGTPFYTPDLSRPADRWEYYRSYSGRITWQMTDKNKVNLFADIQDNCACRRIGFQAPESQGPFRFWPSTLLQARWTRPISSRFLFDSAASATLQAWPDNHLMDMLNVKPEYVSILERSTGFRYNAPATMRGPENTGHRIAGQSAMTYVTGSHTMKAGFQLDHGIRDIRYISTGGNVNYDFLNGVPNRIIQRSTPYLTRQRLMADLGIYVQDQWTIDRLTLNYGLRYDYFNGRVLAQQVAATAFIPERSYAPLHGVPEWHDLNPRLGASYDLFGDGRTALKVSLGRYVSKMAIGMTEAANPITTSINVVNRTWNDADRDYVPDCDLANFGTNGECGAINNRNFGQISPTAIRYADNVMRGFGVREYNWDFTTEVHREIGPGLSVTAGYYRNTAGNFSVTENELVGPDDYDAYCITAPGDPRLPGGGGYDVCGLYDLRPDKFGQSRQVVTQASNFGEQSRVSNFFGVSFNSRFGEDFRMGGGIDTGRITTDQCFVVDSPQQLLHCRVESPLKASTQIKLNGTVPLPANFSLSGTFQNVPGPAYVANYAARNALIAPSLGRNLAACGTRAVCTAASTVPLIAPETVYEDRRTQLDLRITRTFDISRSTRNMRLRLNVDVYNALNSSAILGVNNTYGSRWREPAGGSNVGSAILEGRLLQIGGQLNF